MALRFVEGFDYLPTSSDASDLMRKLGWYGKAQCQISTEARYGGKGLNLRANINNTGAMSFVVDGSPMAKGYWGGAVRWDSSNQVIAFISSVDVEPTILSDNLTSGTLFSIELSVLGQVKAYNGYAGSSGVARVASAGGKSLVSGNWAYLEVGWDFDTNTLEVRVNTVPVIYLTGIVFYQTGITVSIDTISLGYTIPLGATYWDDLYVCDATGSMNNGFLGNVRAQWLPLASNDTTQWTSYNGSVANYVAASNSNVNDTSYVKNLLTETGDYDLYNVTPMVNTPVVFGLAVKGAYRQDDATQGFVKNTLKSGSTQVDGATYALYTTYTFDIDIFETDPNTSAGWLYSAVNSIKIGPKQA